MKYLTQTSHFLYWPIQDEPHPHPHVKMLWESCGADSRLGEFIWSHSIEIWLKDGVQHKFTKQGDSAAHIEAIKAADDFLCSLPTE